MQQHFHGSTWPAWSRGSTGHRRRQADPTLPLCGVVRRQYKSRLIGTAAWSRGREVRCLNNRIRSVYRMAKTSTLTSNMLGTRSTEQTKPNSAHAPLNKPSSAETRRSSRGAWKLRPRPSRSGLKTSDMMKHPAKDLS